MTSEEIWTGDKLTRRNILAAAGKAALAGIALPLMDLGRVPSSKVEAITVHCSRSDRGPTSPGRQDIRGNDPRRGIVEATPLVLDLLIVRPDGSPVSNAIVEVWNADATAVISDVYNPRVHEDTSGENWLRGWQSADAQGRCAFTTVVPGWQRNGAPEIFLRVCAEGFTGVAVLSLPKQAAQNGAIYRELGAPVEGSATHLLDVSFAGDSARAAATLRLAL